MNTNQIPYAPIVGDYTNKTSALIRAHKLEVLQDYKLKIHFTNGEVKIFDVSPLLVHAHFAPLKNKALFSTASIAYGTVMWLNGDIDLAPEALYDEGVALE